VKVSKQLTQEWQRLSRIERFAVCATVIGLVVDLAALIGGLGNLAFIAHTAAINAHPNAPPLHLPCQPIPLVNQTGMRRSHAHSVWLVEMFSGF
jgi:hypothetical protein